MLPRHPVLKFLAVSGLIAGGLLLALFVFLFVYFDVDHTLVTYKLPGGHSLSVVQDREFDLADSVLCRLDGPQVSHSRRWVAAIGSGDSAPGFTLHSATNAPVYWVTADTMPHSILYLVDFQSRSFWPGFEDGEHESASGNRLLTLANSQENAYRLHQHEWIGVKR